VDAVQLVSVDREPDWDRIVLGLPGHGIYQAWSWGEIRRAPGRVVRRYALLAAGSPRAAAAVELHRLRRLPFSVAYAPAGPLWSDDDDLLELLARLADALRADGALYLKVNPRREESAADILARAGLERLAPWAEPFGGVLPLRTAVVDLGPGLGAAGGAAEADARRRVRQAARRGVGVEPEGESSLAEFHAWLIAAAAHRRFALPAADVLRAMLRTWLQRDQGELLVARHGGRCVGGAICSFFGDEAVGHFIADDAGQRPLSATYALYAAGIAAAVRRGCRYMDLGGIRDAAQDGLFRFKRQFGAVPRAHVGEWNLPLQRGWYRALALASAGRFGQRI